MPRPLIGVTLDAEKPGGYSKFPWYALRQNYLGAIDAAGGQRHVVATLGELARELCADPRGCAGDQAGAVV